MTTKELRKELIKFWSEKYCSRSCKFISYKIVNNCYADWRCNLKGEENTKLKFNTNKGMVLRCQSCKDLFK